LRRDRRATRREAIIFYDGTAPFEERTEASVVAEQLVGALAEARFEISEDLGPFEWTDVDDAIEPKDFTAAVDHEGNEGLSISRMQGVALGMPDADYAAAVRIVTEIATPAAIRTNKSPAPIARRPVQTDSSSPPRTRASFSLPGRFIPATPRSPTPPRPG